MEVRPVETKRGLSVRLAGARREMDELDRLAQSHRSAVLFHFLEEIILDLR